MAGDQVDKDAAAAVAKLHLDEATGEMVSKTELKKRLKARQREAEKAGKQAATASTAAPESAPRPSAGDAEAAEKDLNPSQV